MSQIVLTSLPGVVLGEIVEKLDLFSILTLRKVCHSLRDFIDQFKPKSNFNEICVEFSYPGWIIWRFTDEEGNSKTIKFKSKNSSCIVETHKKKKKTKILKDLSHLDVFLRDFEDVMKYHQRKFLESLSLCFNTDRFNAEILESLRKMAPLRVKNLELKIWGPGQLQDLLSCVQPGILESIDFTNYGLNGSNYYDDSEVEEQFLDLENISKMEQWKKAKSVDCHDVNITASIQHFLHFERVTVGVETVPYTEIVLLKEKMQASKTLKEFCIDFNDITNDENLDTVFGASLKVPGRTNEKQWYFRIQNSMEILRLVITDSGRITFDRVLRTDVPKNVEIRS